MNMTQRFCRLNTSTKIFCGLLVTLLFLVSCNVSQPRLKEIAQEMTDEVVSSDELKHIARKTAKSLISAAASNYSPKYASQVEELFELMVDPERASVDTEGTASRGLLPVQVSDFEMSEEDFQKKELSYQEKFGVSQDEEISIDVGLLLQRTSENALAAPVAFDDGERLYSDPRDPMAGDKVKITFQTNCNCYVYIVGIDGTGFVAPIYPDYGSVQTITRVVANQKITIPQENHWLALDGQVGVETIHVITSLHRLPELENKTKGFANTQRETRKNYIPVEKAPMLSRGIVTVKAGESESVNDSIGEPHLFSPTSYLSKKGGDYLAVTRWFFQENMLNNNVQSGL